MHFNYVFRCIFNVCFIFKVNSDTFFALLFPFVAHLGIGPRRMSISSSANRRRNSAAAILTNRRQPVKQKRGRFRSQTFNF